MAAYRFCRTDDIELLVNALNHCWAPQFPEEPLMTAAVFKRSIRDLQVWCSSCMVAFSGSDPIGVLIGAKRPSATLIHKIAVHPEHQRQGHARHLLDSLGSKLAILGPPRIVTEVPESFSAACELFGASGYVQEAVLTDYVADTGGAAVDLPDRFVIPVTVDDLTANGLLGGSDSTVCWARAPESIAARKDEIAGLAVASEDQLEAYVLYSTDAAEAHVLSLRSLVDDDGARLSQLVSRLHSQFSACSIPKAHPSEVPRALLTRIGFRATHTHRLYATTARSA